jgi:hypothetical protein
MEFWSVRWRRLAAASPFSAVMLAVDYPGMSLGLKIESLFKGLQMVTVISVIHLSTGCPSDRAGRNDSRA